MKTKSIVLIVLSCLFLSSCIVKSLHPFYTKETIFYTKDLLGDWTDQKKGTWKVLSFKKVLKEDKATKEDLELLKEYKNSYYTSYKKENKETIFLVTPFKINNQLFLDFLPTGFGENKNLNTIEKNHIVYSHSLVKVNTISDQKIEIKWFDEDELKKLFDEQRINIKHEKIGIGKDDYLLTASSNEIQAFLKKYLTTESAKNWETSTKFILTKTNEIR